MYSPFAEVAPAAYI